MTGVTSGGVVPPAPTPPPAPLPPAPPLGPVPEPLPNCTTCRFPEHSWDTIPASIHTALEATGPDGTFNEADLETLRKAPLITLEKWQGDDATDASGKRVFLWEEDAWINTAKQIKAVNPNAAVIVWMDTMLVYTGWRLDGMTGDPVVNHTLNPYANSACATGHLRSSEWISRYPELMVHNSSNELALSLYGNCYVYDHSQPRVRQYWRDNCIRLTQSGVIDGCGADFSAGQHNSMARNTVEDTMQFLSVNRSVAESWQEGRRQMMIDTTAALGGGILVGKDGAELGDHVNAVLHEGCRSNNGTINLLQGLAAKAKAMGQRQVYQCHGDSNDNVIAAFLIGAGRDHYILTGGWNNGVGGHWPAIFDRPLGAPLADGIYDPETSIWTREFASGTRVSFNAATNVGTIQWASQVVV